MLTISGIYFPEKKCISIEPCDNCLYTGYYSKIKFDKKSDKYLTASIAQG